MNLQLGITDKLLYEVEAFIGDELHGEGNVR